MQSLFGNTSLNAATTIELHEEILQDLSRIADKSGTELYVVGGYVRDAILGRPRKDIDCTVVGDVIEFSKLVAEYFNSHPVVYERFRTVMVPVRDYNLEFVGTRKEEYKSDSRKPIVTEGTLFDDLERRDFTVNALAVKLTCQREGEIIDEFNGIEDLQSKILRTPKDPFVTFSDDPLRMMRAARFASQLQFSIDDNALTAMQQMADRITIISQERITDEFLKILNSPKPSVGINILHTTGLLKYVFPDVERLAGVDLATVGNKRYSHKDVYHHTLKVVDNVCSTSTNVWLRLATLLHDIAKPKTKKFIEGIGWTFHGHEELGARWVAKMFRTMKLPLEHVPYVETLVRLHQRPMQLVDEGVTDSAIRRLAVAAGETLDDLFLLCKADITTQNEERAKKYLKNYEQVYMRIKDVIERDNLAKFQSPVRGEEIMEICSIPPSKMVGIIKQLLEEAILDGVIPNEYEAVRAYFLDNLNEIQDKAKEIHDSIQKK